jgi:predicted metal-dependent hydrolase
MKVEPRSEEGFASMICHAILEDVWLVKSEISMNVANNTNLHRQSS